jgi:methionyl-tRNA synthetase
MSAKPPAAGRRILVTSALPYASGPIHMGHLVEYIQTDIWVRFQRLIGNECVYVCASDAHGTPIMLKARNEGVTPEELVEHFRVEHEQDFGKFLIEFDNFYTTHSDENRKLVEMIYTRLKDKGLIHTRTIEQAYDAEAGMFLPDRFVRGTCPHCGAEDQYGDNCEVCSRTYLPSDLIDPKSIVSGTTPVRRDSEHYFFHLQAFEDSLRQWTSAGHLDAGVARKLNEWFDSGLQDWDISRDAPYFGFRIPDTEDKYFYVWLDAPVGYMASLVNLAEREQASFDLDTFFAPDADSELYHFIGKDIAYFHTLFWPAVLEGADFRKPTGVFVHGFLTVGGLKMSKSRGTFISAAEFHKHLNPEHLRYYYAFKLSTGTEDIDLNLADFVARTNSDLVGKFVNIASRCAGFITKKFDGRLSPDLDQPELYASFVDAGDSIAQLYEGRDFARAMREIMKLADQANQYIDEHKPWVLAKDEQNLAQVQRICTQGINFFRALMIYLAPVLPGVAQAAEEFLSAGALTWDARRTPLLDREIQRFKPLITRVDEQDVANLLEASKDTLPGGASKPNANTGNQ